MARCLGVGRRVTRCWVGPVLLVCTAVCWAPKAEAQAARVTVTINSVRNRACIDQLIFCGKADMLVRVALRQPNGTLVACPDTTPIANFDNIGPLAWIPMLARRLNTTGG